MIKKTIKYTDYDGNERKEDYYFSLNRAEIAEMDMREPGGFEKMVENIIAEQDNNRILTLFKKIILMSYGKKSQDGKQFIKNEQLRTEFEQSEAYVELFMELGNDGKAAAEFIDGIIPKAAKQNENSTVAIV